MRPRPGATSRQVAVRVPFHTRPFHTERNGGTFGLVSHPSVFGQSDTIRQVRRRVGVVTTVPVVAHGSESSVSHVSVRFESR